MPRAAAIPLSRRARRIAPSATLAITSRAKALKAAGQDVIGLAGGEPVCETPLHIRQAAEKAMAAGHTRYAPTEGLAPLREAIAAKLQRDQGLTYEPADVFVGTGAKQCLHNLILALCDARDEVLCPAPYWVSYPDMAVLAEAQFRTLPTKPERGFLPDPDELAAAITPRTRVFIINSPNNPTGAVYDEGALAALGDVLQTAQRRRSEPLWIISDEIYEHLVYDGARHQSIFSTCPELKEQGFVVNGLSKSYAMTGWRIGYAAGPRAVISACIDIQSHTTSGANTIAQHAALAALTGPSEPLRQMHAAFTRQRAALLEELSRIPDLPCIAPRGAFYAFPDVSAYLGRGPRGRRLSSVQALCERALEEALVALVPGEAFGAPAHLRVSFTEAEAVIRNGVGRLREFLSSLPA